MTTELDRAYAHCQRIARSQARNFYYAFRTLPAAKRRAIYAAYAFCRLCDDIADEENPVEEKRRLFAQTRRLLHSSRDAAGSHPVFVALGDAVASFGIPAQYFEDVIQGVEMDLSRTRYANFEELRAYCYKVASSVGLICMEVFGYEHPNAKHHAIDLGLAMQLTNVLRDVREDLGRGRIYIPQDEMARFGYSEREMERGEVNDAFRELMRLQVARARGYFESGRRLIPLVPLEARACPRVLVEVYSAILDRIESLDYDVFQRRIGLTGREKLYLLAKSWAASRLPAAYPQRG